MSVSEVADNIRCIRGVIAEAAARSGRNPTEVKLMAVTKTVEDDRIREAIEAGVDIIGENYVQEGKRKIEKLDRGRVEWHLIGHLQSNKAKYAVRLFDLIHSVDRMSLAQELDRRSGAAGLVTKVLIEVNLSGEETKTGVAKAEAVSLVRDIAKFENLSVRGLMTMPPWFDDPEGARPYFIELKKLRDRIEEAEMQNVRMEELSMGMTGDYRVAVEEGATIVRIGRGLFGERPVRERNL